MNNVVTINRKSFLTAYAESERKQRAPEPVIFFGGVFLSLILPSFVYVSSGGPVSVTAFAIVASAGVILGVIGYLYPAPEPPSIIAPGSARRSPDTVEPPQRKAA